jgi:hypothetical protein
VGRTTVRRAVPASGLDAAVRFLRAAHHRGLPYLSPRPADLHRPDPYSRRTREVPAYERCRLPSPGERRQPPPAQPARACTYVRGRRPSPSFGALRMLRLAWHPATVPGAGRTGSDHLDRVARPPCPPARVRSPWAPRPAPTSPSPSASRYATSPTIPPTAPPDSAPVATRRRAVAAASKACRDARTPVPDEPEQPWLMDLGPYVGIITYAEAIQAIADADAEIVDTCRLTGLRYTSSATPVAGTSRGRESCSAPSDVHVAVSRRARID